jgi:hypothetical protein
MRRRWKALVVVGAVALTASMFFLLPPPDDGLDWIRRYGGSEVREASDPIVGGLHEWNVRLVWHTFSFDRIPSQLIADIQQRNVSDATILVDSEARSVVVNRVQPMYWWEVQWEKLRLWFQSI